MTVNLGYEPRPMTVTLSRGANFVCRLAVSDGSDWPPGTAIDLIFPLPHDAGDVTWPAVITGPTAEWDVPAAEVDTLITAGPSTARLWYRTATLAAVLWHRGAVRYAS